jgi:hypothetical protein
MAARYWFGLVLLLRIEGFVQCPFSRTRGGESNNSNRNGICSPDAAYLRGRWLSATFRPDVLVTNWVTEDEDDGDVRGTDRPFDRDFHIPEASSVAQGELRAMSKDLWATLSSNNRLSYLRYGSHLHLLGTPARLEGYRLFLICIFI